MLTVNMFDPKCFKMMNLVSNFAVGDFDQRSLEGLESFDLFFFKGI